MNRRGLTEKNVTSRNLLTDSLKSGEKCGIYASDGIGTFEKFHSRLTHKFPSSRQQLCGRGHLSGLKPGKMRDSARNTW
jgi:hypothetical protein